MITLIIGNNQYIIQQELNKFENKEYLETWQEAITSIINFNLFQESKTVVIQSELKNLSSNETEINNIANSPNLLVIITSTLDRKTKMGKIIASYSNLIKAEKPAAWDRDRIKNLAIFIARDNLIKLDDKSLDYLVASTGNDILKLSNEIKKISLLGKETTPKEITKIISDDHQTITDLTKSILKQNYQDTIYFCNKLIEKNIDSIKILSTVVHQMIKYLKVLQNSPDNDLKDIAKYADITNPQRIYFMRKEVNWSEQKLLQICNKLLELIERVKIEKNFNTLVEISHLAKF